MALEIQTGEPTTDGLCLCYCDNPALPRFTERKLLMWFRGQWHYPTSDQLFRGHVYAWIMPPVLKTEYFQMSPVEDWAKLGEPLQEYDL